jgi:DnaJ-class molecular chaperone
MPDPYAILGVRRDAPIDEIKRAFRARARQLHPDSDRGNPEAEERFKTLVAAYERVCESWKRKRHRPGNDNEDNPAGGSADSAPAGFKVKGADVTYTLSVTFEEAARGVTHRIDTVSGKKLAIKVPPATLDGHILRLRGEGMPGMGGRAAGDALVELRVAPHPVFSQRGHDIHMEVAVTLAEAVLGGRVDVPTVDGPVTVTVPPGSNTGSILRLRAKGLPRGNDACGDQYITLRVVLPSSIDEEFIQFVKRWHAEHPYTVRKPQRQRQG